MRILVLVKQVPAVAELILDPVTKRLVREGVASLINPFDRRAVLESLRLREERGGSVVVLSMGPPQAESALRECLALGVDEAIHLCDRAFAGADTLATARALARAAERLRFDLILAGRYSIDSETGQVGPEVAALLDVPLVPGVRRLAFEGSEEGVARLRAECEGDDGVVEIDCSLPALLTCTDRWKTRVPMVMPDDERALRPVSLWTAADLGGVPGDYGQAGSPTWVEEVRPVLSHRAGRVVSADADREQLVREVGERIRAAQESGKLSHRAERPRHRRLSDPRGGVWVVGERTPTGSLRPITRELLWAADELARTLACGVAVFLLEPRLPEGSGLEPAVDQLAAELGAQGADVLITGELGAPQDEETRLRLLEAAIRSYAPRIVLAPATSLGRDLMPRVAARLGLGLTGDAIGVELDEAGRLRQLKPAFGGQVVAPILSRTLPAMTTLRPGVLDTVLPDPMRAPAEIVRLRGPDGSRSHDLRCLTFHAEVSAEGAALEGARTVVCVGYGLGKEGVRLADDLARRLGGVMAGTRRVCDLGWLPRQLQIGLSGRSVAPDVYLALGVRGSFNHLVGLRRAKTVIVVNKDPDAEFFADADLGVVADAASFAADLLRALGDPS